MKAVQVYYFAFLIFFTCFLSSCTPSFEEINFTVTGVYDGHNLELSNGVIVKLVGVEGTARSQKYLEENVLQKKVNVRFDSQNYPVDLSPGQVIYGYAQLINGLALNGTLVKQELASLDYSNASYDSASTFEFYASIKTNALPAAGFGGNKETHQKPKNNVNSGYASSLGNLVEHVEKSVFLVSTYDENGNGLSQGTGFFVGKDGYAVSNYHVFENGSKWQITTSDQIQHDVVEIIDSSKEYDYVIFKIDSNIDKYSPLKIAPHTPRKADDIFVVGNPRGLESTFTRGVVSAIRAIDNSDDIIQFDAAISPGSSGSPVMNMKGEVLGIATMKFQECENCNFAMNISLLNLR